MLFRSTHAIDSGAGDGSPMRKRIESAFDTMVNIAGQADADAASRIAKLDLDVLVNLNGFFGSARPGVFARRPARVQVNYLGFPGTLGSPAIDYLLADAQVLPQLSYPHYTEKIAWLPHCYQANDARKAIAPQVPARATLGLPEHGFVFCCFNNSYKILPATFASWMNILRAVPGSVLWLIDDNEIGRAHV